jgi:hypothetical protein
VCGENIVPAGGVLLSPYLEVQGHLYSSTKAGCRSVYRQHAACECRPIDAAAADGIIQNARWKPLVRFEVTGLDTTFTRQ